MIGLTRSTVPSARRYSLQVSRASTTSTSVDCAVATTERVFTRNSPVAELRRWKEFAVPVFMKT